MPAQAAVAGRGAHGHRDRPQLVLLDLYENLESRIECRINFQTLMEGAIERALKVAYLSYVPESVDDNLVLCKEKQSVIVITTTLIDASHHLQ